MQKYHDEPKQYKGYLKSALTSRISRGGSVSYHPPLAAEDVSQPVDDVTIPESHSRFWKLPRLNGASN